MDGDGEDAEEEGDSYDDDEDEDVGRKRIAPAKRGAGSSRFFVLVLVFSLTADRRFEFV
jgi:hypothetical protein